MNVLRFLERLGIENQQIINEGSGSDFDLIEILNRYLEVSEDENTFEDISRATIKYMKRNHHPHTRLIADNQSCEVLEGVKVITIEKPF